MTILYYYADYGTSMYTWQYFHIIDEMRHHDINFTIINPLKYKTIEEANRALVRKVKDSRIDLFLTPHNEEFIFKETVFEIKKMGIPTILYLFDSLMTPLKHRKIAPVFDLVMISQNDEKGIFTKYNRNVIVSHYAANPYGFKFMRAKNTIPRLCFPGTPYGSRADIINNLAAHNIPIDLYGGGVYRK